MPGPENTNSTVGVGTGFATVVQWVVRWLLQWWVLQWGPLTRTTVPLHTTHVPPHTHYPGTPTHTTAMVVLVSGICQVSDGPKCVHQASFEYNV